jgi:hypothetical protein
MATTASTETLPKSKESVVKKEPLPVVEIPQKKVVLVKEKSQDENSTEDVQQTESKQQEMEVDLTEDVISPDNQT